MKWRYSLLMSVTAKELQSALAACRQQSRSGVLETGRYRMRYFSWGTGPPLVFIHGMADVGLAFAMVMHRLCTRFTSIAYELPNGANDGAQLVRYRHSDYTADLVALLDHLKHDRAALVGSSFGSTIALAAMASMPERFTHGVLQNGFAFRPLNRVQRMFAQVARFWPGWFADWPELHRIVMTRIEHASISQAPREIAAFYRASSARDSDRGLPLRALAIDSLDLRQSLSAIRIPTLLLCGDCDHLVPQSCWDDLAASLPFARRIEIAGCGHYPQYTHPAQMAGAIESFLRECH